MILENMVTDLNRRVRKIQDENEELKNKLKAIEYEINNSDMGTAVDNIIKIIKGT